jgi:hypothetical protein
MIGRSLRRLENAALWPPWPCDGWVRFVAHPKGFVRRGVNPTPGSIDAFPRIEIRRHPQLPIGHLWSITLNDGDPRSVAARVDAPVMRPTCLILRLTVITLSRGVATVRTDGDGTFYPRWGPSNASPRLLRSAAGSPPRPVFLARPVIRTGTVCVASVMQTARFVPLCLVFAYT